MYYDRSMTATTYLIDKASESVLLHVHKKSGALYPLGGHIEPFELPHEAALREIREESGLSVSLADPKSRSRYTYCEIQSPLCMLLENTGTKQENIDFIYAAFLPDDFDISSLQPNGGESKRFYLATRSELLCGRLSPEKGCDTEIQTHIRETALTILNVFLEK